MMWHQQQQQQQPQQQVQQQQKQRATLIRQRDLLNATLRAATANQAGRLHENVPAPTSASGLRPLLVASQPCGRRELHLGPQPAWRLPLKMRPKKG